MTESRSDLDRWRTRAFDWCKRLTAAQANPRTLAAFRIYYALVGLVYVAQCLRFVDLTWWTFSANTIALVKGAHVLWMVTLLAIACGRGGPWVRALNYVLCVALLDFLPTGFSVQESLFQLLALFLIPMPVDRAWVLGRDPHPGPTPAWPGYLMIANFGVIFFIAGVFKLFDPYWIDGWGFYATMALPWIRAESADWMIEIEWLMYAYNEVSIVFECGFVIMFVWPRLRWMSALVLTAFFAQLTWPIRLDLIAWHGMGYGILIASMTTWPRFVRRFWTRGEAEDTAAERSSEPPRRWVTWASGAAVVFLTASIVVFGAKNLYQGLRTPLPDAYPYQKAEAPPGSGFSLNPIATVRRSLALFNKHGIRHKRWLLFTRRHLNGIYLYRAIVHYEDGATEEPMVVFEPDMRPGPISGGFTIRHPQAIIYPLSDIANKRSIDPEAEPTPRELLSIQSIVGYVGDIAARPDDVAHVDLLVRRVVLPYDFGGLVPGYDPDEPWTPFYRYVKPEDEFAFIGQPTPFEKQSRVTGLPNFWKVGPAGLY